MTSEERRVGQKLKRGQSNLRVTVLADFDFFYWIKLAFLLFVCSPR